MRVFSFGGGVQSVAVLVLAAQGKVQYDHFLFANVGSDSEHPATLAYLEEYALPYAQEVGIDLVELRRTWQRGERAGQEESIYRLLMRPEGRSVPIPVWMPNGAPGRRACTANFKIGVINRWLRQHGATADSPATVGLGISLDEVERMKESPHAYVQNEWPLIDLRLRRSDCESVIREAGLPVPPKSACWFCPFMSPQRWQDMKRDEPELFERAVELEQHINAKRTANGMNEVYLHRSAKPLDQAVSDQMTFIDQLDMCESGYCFT